MSTAQYFAPVFHISCLTCGFRSTKIIEYVQKEFRVFSTALESMMEHCMRGCTALGTICITH